MVFHEAELMEFDDSQPRAQSRDLTTAAMTWMRSGTVKGI